MSMMPFSWDNNGIARSHASICWLWSNKNQTKSPQIHTTYIYPCFIFSPKSFAVWKRPVHWHSQVKVQRPIRQVSWRLGVVHFCFRNWEKTSPDFTGGKLWKLTWQWNILPSSNGRFIHCHLSFRGSFVFFLQYRRPYPPGTESFTSHLWKWKINDSSLCLYKFQSRTPTQFQSHWPRASCKYATTMWRLVHSNFFPPTGCFITVAKMKKQENNIMKWYPTTSYS